MSEAAPSSMPEAAARFRTPPRALVDCSTSHPASAIYLRASADSEAENTVVAPYSLAVDSSSSSSSPVAPDMAWTSDMVPVKPMPRSSTLPARFFSPWIAERIASAFQILRSSSWGVLSALVPPGRGPFFFSL